MPPIKVEKIIQEEHTILEIIMEENPAIGCDDYIIDNIPLMMNCAADKPKMVRKIVSAICSKNRFSLEVIMSLKEQIGDDQELISAMITRFEQSVRIENALNIQTLLNSFFKRGMNYRILRKHLEEWYTPEMFHNVFDDIIDDICVEFSITPEEIFP
ncbi:MAG: hypothetical protein MJ154_02720 [Candidatus Saccharibacteria bacterium]|nr:hypothetical protein [Candidatus Saccharibacteria bacterium]